MKKSKIVVTTNYLSWNNSAFVNYTERFQCRESLKVKAHEHYEILLSTINTCLLVLVMYVLPKLKAPSYIPFLHSCIKVIEKVISLPVRVILVDINWWHIEIHFVNSAPLYASRLTIFYYPQSRSSNCFGCGLSQLLTFSFCLDGLNTFR